MRLFRHPILCNYYLTYRCNAKCGFCDIWEKPSPYVTHDNVRENLQALKRMGVRVVDFTGGEPLLHRGLPDFLEMAKSRGFVTTVTTNALLYPKYAERLRGLVDMLHFSLDSVDRDKHNESRGVPCFDHVLQSIEVAKALGERPDILFTVTEENVGEIEAAWNKFAMKEDLVLILNPVFEYNEVGKGLGKEALRELKRWQGRRNIYLNGAFLTLREQGGNSTANPVCRAGSTTVVISPENKLVLPCYHLGLEEVAIDRPLDELYRTDAVQGQVALEGRHEKCEGCVINCYMEPSMASTLSPWFLRSVGSTFRYSLEKWVYGRSI